MKNKKDQDRCTGHCCTNFYLPLSPDEIQRGYDRWKAGGTATPMNGGTILPVYTDIHLLAPMVTYLGEDAVTPKAINPSDQELLGNNTLVQHRYSCKHFDSRNKVCTIYAIRPAMCRDYPNSGRCNYHGCTWKSHKAKRETKKQINERLKVLNQRLGVLRK